MTQYETVLTIEPKRKNKHFLKIVRNALGTLGVLTVGSALALSAHADLRSRVFFSRPMQAIFSNEMDLLSARLGAGDVQEPLKSRQEINSRGSALTLLKINTLDFAKPLSPGQREVANYLAKRYRVSAEAVESIVRLAYKVGKEEQVEPTLILAIVGVESSYNPFAASSVGAHGLMQVMPNIHKDKFEALSPGDWSALNPEMNMRVGAKIIHEYARRTGSINAGLRWYVGAAVHGNDGGYPEKVLFLKSRIDLAYRQGLLLATTEKKAKESSGRRSLNQA